MNRTASYLVLGIVLGVSQYVELQVCDICGAVVHDNIQHNLWHDSVALLLP